MAAICAAKPVRPARPNFAKPALARGFGLAFCALALGATSARAAEAIAPPPLDPAIAAIVGAVSAAKLRATDERLAGFGTRNAFSEKLAGRTRGVMAARDWIAAQFRDIAASSGGRMTVEFDTYLQPKIEDTPRDVTISSVIATLRGHDPSRGTYVISSHYDSRNSDGTDATLDAPGADDNGSGVSAAIEAARVLAPHHFAGTLVFACFDGEEQGLFGSNHYAGVLAARRVNVEADLNNDIVGASIGPAGEQAPSDVRLFSEALPRDSDPRRVNHLGAENDSPARELARFTKEVDAVYVPAMRVTRINRTDRFLRGGDQESFSAQGFPAVRFVEAHETFAHQHQNVRVENGVQYGDLLQFVDFDYLARVTQLNVAALATLATAPAAPRNAGLLAKTLGYDSTLTWDAVPGAASYEVVWRATTEPEWTNAKDAGNVTSVTLPLSKDDWLLGVRAVDAAGHKSVVAFPKPVR